MPRRELIAWRSFHAPSGRLAKHSHPMSVNKFFAIAEKSCRPLSDAAQRNNHSPTGLRIRHYIAGTFGRLAQGIIKQSKTAVVPGLVWPKLPKAPMMQAPPRLILISPAPRLPVT
jgi:hypothetical protein